MNAANEPAAQAREPLLALWARAIHSEGAALNDYLCLAVLSKPSESQADFSSRLSRFWTHMLRNCKADFERVYAETCRFESTGDCLSRKYLFEEVVLDRLERELHAAGLGFEPIDRDDVYSKYEASPPEWMQIEH
jgi:hypothetical protein